MQQWLEDMPNPPDSKALLEGVHIIIIPYALFEKIVQ